MESNDRLNWQDDKEIEKIIPFDKGILYYLNIFRTIAFQWCRAEDKQMEPQKWAHSLVDYKEHLSFQKKA